MSPHVFGARVRARVAILHSPETRWAFQEQPLTTPQGFAVEPQVRLALPGRISEGSQPSSSSQMTALLAAFRVYGLGVDVVFVPADAGPGLPPLPLPDLSPYAIVLAPTLWVVPDALAAALAAYVAHGGCLLLTMRSGSKNGDNQYPAAPLPGAVLGPLAGVTTNEASGDLVQAFISCF